MKRGALVAVLLVALVALPLVLGAGPRIAASLLDSNLAQPTALAAPPTLRLSAPADGEGVPLDVRLAGLASADATAIRDVQVRIDGGAWQSLPDAPTGASASAFASTLSLTPGPHLLEARATDGASSSSVASVRVLAGATTPPTVTIARPSQGDGLATGDILAAGTARGASRVVVRWDDAPQATATLVDDAWRADATLAPGLHRLEARGVGPAGSGLTERVDFLVGDAPPPTVRILQPADASSFGSGGDAACVPSCIQVSGVAPGASRVVLAVDGGAPHEAALVGAAWSWPLSTDALFSGAHRVEATPYAGALPGLPQTIDLLVRTPRELAIQGDATPRPTGTPLAFRVASAPIASWRLDGVPLADGPVASFSLGAPGLHRLGVEARDAQGRSGSLLIPLLALDRAPTTSVRATASGLLASFHASAADPDDAVVSYQWEMGDGSRLSSSEADVAHRYASEGTYVVNVTAQDASGAFGSQASIRVVVKNGGPLVDFSWAPESPTIRDAVSFFDASFSDTAGALLRSWSFDDASQPTPPSNASSVTHTFATRGPHVVTLRVTDARGLASTATRAVVVANLPPAADFAWQPAVPTPGAAVAFADTTTKPDGAIVARSWDFGDGATSSTAGPAHAFSATGAYPVTLSVTDDMGATVNVTKTIVVVDATIHVNAVRMLPEVPRTGDPVRFSLDADAIPTRTLWQFGDGASSTDLAPLHAYARHGNYSGNVTAIDDAGHVVSLAFHLDVGAQPPRANLTVGTGGYAQFPTLLLANVSASEGRPIRYAFDMDGDGAPECDGPEPRCVVVYPRDGAYTALVTVTDDAGANATVGLALTVLPPPSTLAPPTLDVRSPRPGAQLRGVAMLQGFASAPRPIDAVEIQLRRGAFTLSPSSGPWASANGNTSWSLQLDTRPYPDGDYDLAIRARDADGGEALELVPITLVNGVAAPEVTVALVDVPANPIREETILHGSAYHPAGVSSVRYQLDGGAWLPAQGPPLAFRIALKPAELARGEHTLLVEAARGVDDRAQTSATFRVGGDPPTLVVDESPNAVSYGLLHAAGRLVGAGRVEYRIDDGVWTPATGNETWSVHADSEGMPNGRHELSLRAVGPYATSEPVTYATRVLNPPKAEAPPAAPTGAPATTREVPLPLWTLGAAVCFALLRRRA